MNTAMTPDQKRLMWTDSIICGVNMFLCSFTGIYLALYTYQNIDSQNLSVARIVDAAIGVFVYQFLCDNRIITWTRNNVVILSVIASSLMAVQGMIVKIYPEIAIIIQSINVALFVQLCMTGFKDIENQIFTKRNRTIQQNRRQQFRYAGLFIAGMLSYFMPTLFPDFDWTELSTHGQAIDVIIYIQYIAAVTLVGTETYLYFQYKKALPEENLEED